MAVLRLVIGAGKPERGKMHLSIGASISILSLPNGDRALCDLFGGGVCQEAGHSPQLQAIHPNYLHVFKLATLTKLHVLTLSVWGGGGSMK